MPSVNDTLTGMQNQTAIQEAYNRKINGSSNELDQDMFLKLMLEQLKHQDPLNPMSNQEFLAQQAQFTQLSELQKLNSNIASNNTVMQAVSLIGKEVELLDPDDPTRKKKIIGIVQEAVFDAQGSSIKVNGKDYPLSLVQGIREPSKAEVGGGGEEDAAAENNEAAQSGKLSDIIGSVSKLAGAAEIIASKIAKYMK
jgi:flagellar basal-body rod modification protein FlgD